MPVTGYLSSSGIQSALLYIANTYPSLSQLITLPEASAEGRSMCAVKIGKSSGTGRPGVLLVAGLHARELVNPDAMAGLALKLCQSHTGNTGISLGGKTYDASTIKTLLEVMDIYILPLVNPDGRTFVQSPAGDAWWRKNRRPIPGSTCIGTDLNRNFDFLWSSGIGASASPCDYQVYKGTEPFSEPETRNVHWLLENCPIKCFMDVHSYSELVLYPWGDDNNQTASPAMNFANPAFDGMRGTLGDSLYKEYIPSADQNWYVSTGARIRDAIAAVRGRTYTLEQSAGLYATSGASQDYAYSCFFASPSKRKVLGFAVETGTQFQPPFPEAGDVMNEAMAGALEFCVASLCVAEQISAGLPLFERLGAIRHFRDEVMLKTAAGRKHAELLSRHTVEILTNTLRDKDLRKRAQDALSRVSDVVLAEKKVFEPALILALKETIGRFSAKASPTFKESLKQISTDLEHFKGRTAMEGLKRLRGGR